MSAKLLAQVLQVLAREGDSNLVANSFFQYCRRHNLVYLLPNVLTNLRRLANEERELRLKLTLPAGIGPDLEAKIRKFVGAGTAVKVEQVIDPDIIGGFIAEYNDLVFDASVTRQLQRLQTVLLN